MPNAENHPVSQFINHIADQIERGIDRAGELVDAAFPGLLSPKTPIPPLATADAGGFDLRNESISDHGLQKLLNADLMSKAKNQGTPQSPVSSSSATPQETPTAREKAPVVPDGGSFIQLSQAGWNKLSAENRHSLLNPSGQMQTLLAPIAARTLNEVSRKKAEYVNEAVGRVLRHPGLPDVLRDLFSTLQTFDPIDAGSKVRLEVLPATALPPERLVSAEPDPSPDSRREHRYTVRSDSGAILVSTPHVFLMKEDPSRPPLVVGGRELAMSLVETLYGEKPEAEQTRRARITRMADEALLEPLLNVNLETLLSSTDLMESASRSPILARHLDLYQELIRELELRQQQYQNAVFGIGFDRPMIEAMQLRTDDGGRLLSWIENQKDLPEVLKVRFERLMSGAIAVDSAEERDTLRLFIMYRSSQSTIRLDIALAPLQEDLKELASLPSHHPLYEPELFMRAQQAVGEVMKVVPAGSQNELRLNMLPDLLHTPLSQFRQQMNEHIFVPFKEEFEIALQGFEEIFRENGRFKPEFRGQSVPVDFLQSTLYGAPVGRRVAENNLPATERFPALSRDDFYHIREAIFYREFAATDDQLVRTLSIPRFRNLVHGVIVAHRKANAVDTQYREWVEGLSDRTALAVPAAGDHLGQAIDASVLAGFTPRVIQGSKLQPHEVFDASSSVSVRHIVDFHEWNAQQRSRGNPRTLQQWSTEQAQITLALEVGLTDGTRAVSKELLRLRPEAEKYVLRETLEKEIAIAEQVRQNPLIRTGLFQSWDNLTPKFLYHKTADDIRRAVAVYNHPELHALFNEEIIRGLPADVSRFVQGRFYLGKFDTSAGNRQLKVSQTWLDGVLTREPAIRITVDGASEDLSFSCSAVTPENLVAARAQVWSLDELLENCDDPDISGNPDTLLQGKATTGTSDMALAARNEYAKRWIAKLQFLSSRAAKEVLQRQGLQLVDTETFRVARDLQGTSAAIFSQVYVSRELVKDLAQVRLNPQQAGPLKDPNEIAGNGFIRWQNGIPCVSGRGKHRDEPLDQIMYGPDSSYVTGYLANASKVGADVAAIAQVVKVIYLRIEKEQRLLPVAERQALLRRSLIEHLRSEATPGTDAGTRQ